MTEFPTDEPLLAQVLDVYRPECRYLLKAAVTVDDEGRPGVRCEFGIPESFYIRGTGHFNAVEFNLCWNQMLYYALAKMVKEQLAEVFEGWTLDDFWARQLPNVLIVDFHSTFRRGVESKRFYGDLRFQRMRTVGGGANLSPTLVADTTVRYWDDADGRCDGQVRVVVTDLPSAPEPVLTGETMTGETVTGGAMTGGAMTGESDDRLDA